MQSEIAIRDPSIGKKVFVDPNDPNHPLLTMTSHIHPFHVIINAHKKFEKWDPPPADESTLKIIAEVKAIWEALNTPPPSSDFLSYRTTDNEDLSALPTPLVQKHRGERTSGTRKTTKRLNAT